MSAKRRKLPSTEINEINNRKESEQEKKVASRQKKSPKEQKRRTYTAAQYKQVLDGYLGGEEDMNRVAEEAGVTPGGAKSIIQHFRDTGATEPKPRGGAHHVVYDTPAILKALIQLLEKNPTMSLADMQRNLIRYHGDVLPSEKDHGHARVPSESWISTTLAREHFTLKVVKHVPHDRNSAQNLLSRKVFVEWFEEILKIGETNRLVWIDEHGFDMWTRRRLGRSREGQSAVQVVPRGRYTRLSLAAALSYNNGVIKSEFYWGTMDGALFENFLYAVIDAWKLKAPHEIKNRGPIIILDNVRTHSKQSLKRVGVDFHFLPAWAPFLNPLEDLFQSHFTEIKRLNEEHADEFFQIDNAPWGQRGALRKALLKKVGESAWTAVTNAEIALNAIMHMMTYFPRCRNKEPIDG